MATTTVNIATTGTSTGTGTGIATSAAGSSNAIATLFYSPTSCGAASFIAAYKAGLLSPASLGGTTGTTSAGGGGATVSAAAGGLGGGRGGAERLIDAFQVDIGEKKQVLSGPYTGQSFKFFNPKGNVPALLIRGGGGGSGGSEQQQQQQHQQQQGQFGGVSEGVSGGAGNAGVAMVLNENAAVLQWIADQAPESGLAPPVGTLQRYELQNKLSFLGTEIHANFGPLFYPQGMTEEAKNKQKEKLVGKLKWLSSHELQDGRRKFLMGDNNAFTIADCYLYVMLKWCNYLQVPLEKEMPVLHEYMLRVGQLDFVKNAEAAMKTVSSSVSSSSSSAGAAGAQQGQQQGQQQQKQQPVLTATAGSGGGSVATGTGTGTGMSSMEMGK